MLKIKIGHYYWYEWLAVGVAWFALFVGVAFATVAINIAVFDLMCRVVGIGCQTVFYSW